MKSIVMSILLVMTIIMMVGCAEKTVITGAVEDVRITSKEISEGGHPVAGAVVGGLLAGTTGAIIGTAMGSNPSKVTVRNGILGAMFIVRLDNGIRVSFTFNANSFGKIRCSLLRTGDKVRITRMSYWGDTHYTWKGNDGELLP